MGISFINKGGTNTDDATATESDILSGKTAYVANKKILGIMRNNLQLNYKPLNKEQIIPEGYTSGGKIESANLQELVETASKEKLGLFTDAIGLTPEILKKGSTVLGIEGNVQEGIDTSDATATEDFVVNPKTFYAKGEKRTGNIEVTTETFASGLDAIQKVNDNAYYVADVNEEYGIAAVYTYNSQDWQIYKWEEDNLTDLLQTINVPDPNMKSVVISKSLNEKGNINIWYHSYKYDYYNDKSTGHIGIVEYNYLTNTIEQQINYTLPRVWKMRAELQNENGNLAIRPTDSNQCAIGFSNIDQFTINFVYDINLNSLTPHQIQIEAPISSTTLEWSSDGNYLMRVRGSKVRPSSIFIYQVDTPGNLTLLLNYDNTIPCTIYNHYIIECNKIYNFIMVKKY